MIVRILGEGQFDLPDAAVDQLNELDEKIEAAIRAGDEATFAATLAEMLQQVRTTAQPVAIDALVPSDLVLPSRDSSLAEVRDLMSDDGLVPGRGGSHAGEAAPAHRPASADD
ncbi:MAG: PspA-associated protein PspAA [Nocardioidaceae bacterium]